MTKISSASRYSRSKNVIVEAVIVPELKLRNVKMQILFADVMKGADDPALDNAPKAFNRIGVDRADHILLLGMVDSGVWVALLAQAMIANPLIGTEQANLVRDGFVDEGGQGRRANILDHASDYVTLAADSTGHDCLARTR
jgi:hypothetical protein